MSQIQTLDTVIQSKGQGRAGKGSEIVIEGKLSEGSEGKSGSESDMPGIDGSNDGNSIGNDIVIEGKLSEGSEGKSGSESDIPGNDGSNEGRLIGRAIVIAGSDREGRLGRSGRLSVPKLHISQRMFF